MFQYVFFSFSPCLHPAWSCASSLHSFQSFYPQHDSVMYLPGSGVIETWPSFFSLLPSLGIALDSHRPPPRPFIQLRAFWGFKCEVLGASSNCLGAGCLAVGTVTVGSPKWANAHEWGFNIFVITFAVGQLIEHLGTFHSSPHICHEKPCLGHILCDFTNHCAHKVEPTFPAGGGITFYGQAAFILFMHIICSFQKDCTFWKNTSMPH